MTSYIIMPGVLSQALNAETVLLDVTRGLYFRLNGSASLLWEGLSAARDVDSIVRGIAERCDVEPGMVRADVDELLDDLVTQRLVARAQ